MKKKGLLSRLLTLLVALSMILTSQTVMTFAQTVVYAQDAEVQEDGQKLQEKEAASEDAEGRENKASDETDNELNTSETEKIQNETEQGTTEKPEEIPKDTEQTTPVLEEDQTAQEILVLTDEQTGVRIESKNEAFSEGTVMNVRQLEEEEISDTAIQQMKSVLAAENFQLEEQSFYDISLENVEMTGKVQVYIPVPENFSGELDAWYIDDNGQAENLTREEANTSVKEENGNKYYVFDTDHFSIYGITSSKAAEEEKEAEKKAEDTVQTEKHANQKNTDQTGENKNQTFEEYAAEHYGENGTMATAEATIAYLNGGKGTIYAGDTVSFIVEYKFTGAAYYNYGEQTQPLFDSYENTKILLHLPEGLSIQQGLEGTLQNVAEIIEPEEGGPNDWTLILSSHIQASSDSHSSFILTLKADGNGSIEQGHIYDFGSGEGLMEIQTEFTIKDRTDPDNIKDGTTYHKKIATASELQNLRTVTDDKWMIEKTAVSAVPDENKEKVTVTFQLAVGLDNNGEIVTNPQSYGRHGRVPFAGGNQIALTETPVVKDRNGEPIQAESITVTPQFGNKQEISFGNSGDTMNIPVDTCSGKTSADTVDDEAPYYSTYEVEIVYPYEDFIAQYYDENQKLLEVENTAKIQYTLATAGGGMPSVSSDMAAQEAGEVTKPACLTLSKYIIGYKDGASSSYIYNQYGANDAVKGPVEYTITGPGESVPKLYTYNADTKTYIELTEANGKVTYDPLEEQENLSGTVTVYLDPGTYTVSETKCPDNTQKVSKDEHAEENAEPKTVTIAAGETKSAAFYNKEKLGDITIQKTGQKMGESQALADAVFGLYRDELCEDKIAEVQTKLDGSAVFDRLPYGTYYIKEIKAPYGYIADTKVFTCRISEEKNMAVVESTNKYNLAPVKLQKQVYDVNQGKYVDVNQTNYHLFAECFEIQKKNEDGSWETVNAGTGGTSALSLGQDGALKLTLPVYREDGKVITYRFAERLPEGYHADKEVIEEGIRVAYTGEFTLEDYIGKAETEAYEITMHNNRNGSIELTKQFYTATASGMRTVVNTNLTASFDLYYQDGESEELKKYNEEPYTVTAGGKISITDLPRTGENGAERKYYLVETKGTDGYIPSGKKPAGKNDAQKKELTIGNQKAEAYGPFNFSKKLAAEDRIVLEQSVTIDNVEQKVPVVVKKVNSYTNEFVAGSAYTIYLYDGGSKGEAVSDAEGVSISSASGMLSKLEPGHKYLIEETTVPKGYQNVTPMNELIVDLTETGQVDVDTEAELRTIKNQPDPAVTVTKQKNGAGKDNTVLNSVQFEVYTKAEDSDTFTRVKGYDDDPLIIASGSKQQIPAGTYYLKEIVPEENPNGILEPSSYPELYDGKGMYTSEGFYFGPYEVKQQQEEQSFGPVVNYSDTGNVTVKKYRMTTGGEKVALSGAKIGIYRENTLIQTAQSESDTGYAEFKDLPIYNENKEKITYTIKEIEAPKGYTASEEILEVQLTPGETVTKDIQGENLEIINQPVTSLQVTKYYYNMWEYAFTQKAYFLPGTVIALYQKNAEGNYKFVETKTTDISGNVIFENLTQKDEYVAIEVCVPDGEAYKYLEPEGRKEYLDSGYTTDEALPQIIQASDLERYSYVEKEANTGEIPQGAQQGSLTNVENWTQLQIKKFVTETQGEHIGEERLINNAQFTLYMQIIEEDSTELKFDLNQNPDSYMVIGDYSSGTLYNSEGIRQDGWFGTNILKSADNVVYWLVETNAGIGASIKPENAVTLIKREGTGYTNVSEYDAGEGEKIPSTNVMEYKDNQVTKEEVENNPEYGGGPAMFSTVRIAKWTGGRTEDGDKVYEYTPLGNATFELYLADSDGNRYTKLDTMTTGLDNNIGETASEDLSAWASSKAFSWKELSELYQKELSEELYNDIFHTDEEGNGYVRVALVESSAPTGYLMEKSTYYMYMFFQKDENKTTEIFNDAYYVKGDHQSEDKDVALAEEQKGIEWALYPTTEEKDGSYNVCDGATAEDSVNKQYRLVNWPVDTQAVTVQKYGYSVQKDNLNLNTEELNEYYETGVHTDRKPLKVTMRLERYIDGKWTAYAYTSDHADGIFSTSDAGYFAFPQGLQMGRYRILEVKSDEGYENIYNGSELTGGSSTQKEAAYYFNVASDNVNITMYNPQKLSLSVKKTDMLGEAVPETKFMLTDQNDGKNVIEGNTNKEGYADLANIESGIYKLSETAAEGYTGSYFAEYFNETYSGASYNNNNGGTGNLNDLVNGNGIFLGYDRQLKAEEDGASVAVTKKTDISNYGINTAERITITVKNPKQISFVVRKQDADTDTFLKNAVFKVEYIPFTQISGDISIDTKAVSWQEKPDVTTDGDGEAVVSGEPGIYRITEKKAPSGYDITDTAPKYAAMTGNLNIGKITADGKEIQKDTDVNLIFQDDQLVNLHVKKEIKAGDLTISGSHTFTFTLYDSAKNKLKELKIETKDGKTATGTFAGLSQGKTYYLKETDMEKGFAFTSLKNEKEGKMTADADGYYKIIMPAEPQDVSVTAENTYLYSKVSIRKVDGIDGTPLQNTEFKAVRMNGGMQEDINVSFKEEESGVYTVVLPLKGMQAETFRIYETQPPSDYLPDTEHYIEVNLTPGEVLTASEWNEEKYTKGEREENNQAMLKDRIFPNYRGAYIDLVKYDNVYAAKESAKVQKGAGFNLYQYNPEKESWEYAGSATTDSSGKIHFTVNGGFSYAIEERTVPEGYKGLEGIYQDDKKADTVEVSVGQEKRTVHLINEGKAITAGITYTYQAYDIPYVALEIQKQNAAEPSKQLTATAAVYEVPDETQIETTEDAERFIGENSPLIDEIQVTHAKSAGDAVYSYADKNTDGRLFKNIVAGKSYLIVEKDADVSQIRENRDVEWYDVITIPEGSRDTQTAVLKNTVGTVPLSLTKTAERTEYPSLFTEGAEISYTLTPKVGTNTYPLADFTVTDEGLTAYNNNIELPDTESYLKGNYSLKKVTVGKAEHETSSYAEVIGNDAIYATVIFYDAGGNEIYRSKPLDISETEKTAELPGNGEKKAAKVEISYESAEFKTLTGYALGSNFKPGTIKITASVEQQQGGIDEQAIDRIENTAKTVLHYYPWDTAGKKADTPTELKKTDAANVRFGEQEAALVSIEKTADETTVNLEDTVTYNITIKNNKDAKAAMQKPFIVDMLPQGTTWEAYDDTHDIFLDAEDTGITYSHMRTQTIDGETGVFVFLNGNLEPGKSITVKLKVRVENAVVSYGTSMKNYVIAGSDLKGVLSESNPQAASFKNENGNWAESVDQVLTTMDAGRRTVLKQILGEQASYGYVSGMASVNWATSSDMVLVKSAYGDLNEDTGYTTDILSTVENGGTMHYRLSVSNISTLLGTTEFAVIDALPAAGDFTSAGAKRESAWALNFGELSRVYKNTKDGTAEEIGSDEYKIYYYSGELNGKDAYHEMFQGVKEVGFDTAELPDGWSATQPQDKKEIKAFIIAVNDTVRLNTDETLVIEYTAQVNGGEDWNNEILNNNSWKNAVNSFSCTYSRYALANPENVTPTNAILGSNQVSNTIMPSQVKVGGHIWIDKDGDGVWEDGESIDSFTENYLIQQLLSEVEVNLYTYRGTEHNPMDVTRYNQAEDTSWGTNAHYIFDNLQPAMLKENISEDTAYPDGKLDPRQLKGSSPLTYQMNITIPEEVVGKYKVTTLGKTSGKSRDPRIINTEYSEEAKDNNFTDMKGTPLSEQFYLWATEPSIYDDTKDIGLVPYRDLTIIKTASDDPTLKVKDAKFTIYGPFADGDDYTLTEEKKVGTYKTDKDGRLTVENLLWYQNYVIVEEETAGGYELEGAQVYPGTGTNIEKIENTEGKPAWVLKTPNDSKDTVTDTITVTNKRIDTKACIRAEKELIKEEDVQPLADNQFMFSLWENLEDIGEKELLQTVGNKADGSVTFAEISYDSPGTHTYFITEQQKEQNPDKGITYDTSVYRATVTVNWTEGEGLSTTVEYEKQGQGGEWIPAETDTAKFTNIYKPEPVSVTPAIKKIITGANVPEGQEKTFRFQLSASEENKADGASLEPGNSITTETTGAQQKNFSPIIFYKEGTYTFTVEEIEGKDKGYTYDTEKWTWTVKIKDENGRLSEESSVYTRGKEKSEEMAVFTNQYQPEKTTYAPKAAKIVTGDAPDKTAFIFTLEAAEEYAEDTVKMPKDTDISVTAGESGTFDAITFYKEGTYQFLLKEKDTHIKGYDYDARSWTLTVEVTDAGGTLQPHASYVQEQTAIEQSDEAQFTNDYNPLKTGYTPRVEKKIAGDTPPEEQKKQFVFTLTADQTNPDGADLPAGESMKTEVTGEGEALFKEITFTETGIYRFSIQEDNGGGAGYTYDNSKWMLTVTVENAGGALAASAVYTKADTDRHDNSAADEEKAVFENIYRITQGTAFAPTVKKTVEGEPKEKAEFIFMLKEKEENPEGALLPENTEVRIEGSGEARFEEILFEQPGTYRFEITEKDTKESGYSYDGNIWTLTVKVKDSGSYLKIEDISYEKAGTKVTGEPEFINRYNPKEVSYMPKVKKNISGDTPPEDKEFTFTMEADAGNPEGGAEITSGQATVNGAGSTNFGEIIFGKEGTYKFEIRETDTGEAGYTYDDSMWILLVEVEDKEGCLEIIKAEYQKGNRKFDTEAAVFTNTYSAVKAAAGAVQTGDTSSKGNYVIVCILSAAAVLLLIRRKRKA